MNRSLLEYVRDLNTLVRYVLDELGSDGAGCFKKVESCWGDHCPSDGRSLRFEGVRLLHMYFPVFSLM